ncbi:46 kDa FK506-binding nuclear protein isoform X2 [Neocloeon triangulifer]|uniref:46 kDa FK506-binding nuclear protein isoform X2 n=1 Tax=Neocloeon triangulifer TaxID=2078957 RepID=UPI00286F8FA8|nr:46 kDa FK506-binding nuclear protein isoform X2 [Neocloeon triangulifer]
MFWGLTLEPGKKYAQQVETSFHISMAALDVRATTDDPISIVVETGKNEFVICNLSKKNMMQQTLDLNFLKDDSIAFTVKGQGVVHLTGYILPGEDEFDEEDFDAMEDEESDEEAPQLQPVNKKELVRENKRKNGTALKTEPAAKKSKVPVMNGNDDSEESDDDEMEDEDVEEEEDDDDDDGDGVISREALESSEEEEEAEEEGEEGEEEEDSDEEESEEEEAPVQIQNKKQKTPQKTPVKDQKKPINGSTPKEQSAKKENKQTPKQQTPKVKEEAKTPSTPAGTKKTIQGGVIIEDLVVGGGPAATNGRQAAVYYVGRNKHNNKQFDATQSGPPFKFRLGKGDVIKGWDIGVQGMKVGGKRRVICPPHMAYGNKGSPPVIPPNSTLVFDIELKAVS